MSTPQKHSLWSSGRGTAPQQPPAHPHANGNGHAHGYASSYGYTAPQAAEPEPADGEWPGEYPQYQAGGGAGAAYEVEAERETDNAYWQANGEPAYGYAPQAADDDGLTAFADADPEPGEAPPQDYPPEEQSTALETEYMGHDADDDGSWDGPAPHGQALDPRHMYYHAYVEAQARVIDAQMDPEPGAETDAESGQAWGNAYLGAYQGGAQSYTQAGGQDFTAQPVHQQPQSVPTARQAQQPWPGQAGGGSQRPPPAAGHGLFAAPVAPAAPRAQQQQQPHRQVPPMFARQRQEQPPHAYAGPLPPATPQLQPRPQAQPQPQPRAYAPAAVASQAPPLFRAAAASRAAAPVVPQVPPPQPVRPVPPVTIPAAAPVSAPAPSPAAVPAAARHVSADSRPQPQAPPQQAVRAVETAAPTTPPLFQKLKAAVPLRRHGQLPPEPVPPPKPSIPLVPANQRPGDAPASAQAPTAAASHPAAPSANAAQQPARPVQPASRPAAVSAQAQAPAAAPSPAPVQTPRQAPEPASAAMDFEAMLEGSATEQGPLSPRPYNRPQPARPRSVHQRQHPSSVSSHGTPAARPRSELRQARGGAAPLFPRGISKPALETESENTQDAALRMNESSEAGMKGASGQRSQPYTAGASAPQDETAIGHAAETEAPEYETEGDAAEMYAEEVKPALSLLGRSETRLPASPDEAVLETFPNPSPARDYTISFATEEFTSVCPVTGQPDFARITLEYVPDVLCVESKSLKFYLASFRNERAFNESVTNRILDDFVRVIQPRKANIRGAFAARGGIALTVTAEYIKPPVVPAPATVATGASTPRRATGPVPLGPGAAAPAEVPSHRPLIRRPAQPSRPIEQGGGRSETETRVL